MRRSFALALAAVLAVPAVLHAQTLSDRVPGDALVYVGWEGAAKLQPQFEKSNLKHIVDASTLPDYLAEQLPKWIAQAGEGNADAAAAAQRGLVIAKALWQYPTAFYMGPMDVDDIRNPSPQVALVCEAGADSPTVADNINKLLAEAEKQNGKPPFPIKAEAVGKTVVFTMGHFDPDQTAVLVGRPAKTKPLMSLKAAKPFQAAIAQVDKDAAITVYADFAGLRTHVLDLLNKAPNTPPEVKTYAPKISAVSGLDGITQLAFTGNFAGANWAEKGFLGAPAPRTGLMVVLDAKPIDDDLLKLVPKDAPSLALSRLDFAKLWAQVRPAIETVEPAAAKNFDQAMGMVQTMTGMDPGKDMVAPLGDQWVAYRTMHPDNMTMPIGFVMINKLRDAKTAAATVAKLEKMITDSGGTVELDHAKVEGGDMTVLKYQGAQVGWIIKGDYLVVGMGQDVEAAAAYIAPTEKKDTILDNPDFVAVRKSFGPNAAKAISLNYENPKLIYAPIAKLVNMYLGIVSAMGNVNIPAGLLPEPEKINEFLTPGGSIGWVEPDGLHIVTNSSMPIVGLLGAGPKLPAPTPATVRPAN